MKFIASLLGWINWVCGAFQTCLLVGFALVVGVVGYVVLGAMSSLMSPQATVLPPMPPQAALAPAPPVAPAPLVRAVIAAPVQPMPLAVVSAPAVVPAVSVELAAPVEAAALNTAATSEVVMNDPDQPPGDDYHWVKPYTKFDGTKVEGHWRKNEKPLRPRVVKEAMPKPPKPPARQVAPSVPSFGLGSSSGSTSSGRVWVDGYTRKDGVKVKGHWRNK